MTLVSAWRTFALALRGSPNVWRIMLFTFLYNCALSVWRSCVWAPFLKAVFSTNTALGWVACGSGLAELTCAVLSGVAADKIGRNVVIRAAAVLMLLASAGMSAGIYFEHFASVVVAAIGTGAAYGAFFPVVEALFADSVLAGHRTEVYSVKYSFETASGLLGVVVALVMFAVMGDEWEVGTMKVVIWSGLGLTALCSLLLWTVRSELALEQIESGDAADDGVRSTIGSDARADENEVPSTNTTDADLSSVATNDRRTIAAAADIDHSVKCTKTTDASRSSAENDLSEALLVNEHEGQGPDQNTEHVQISSGVVVSAATVSRNSSSLRGSDAASASDQSQSEGALLCEDGYDPQHCGILHTPLRFTPHLFGIFGVLLCLGNGMTMMYFNLFLISTFDASPIQVQILIGSSFVTNVLFAQVLALADSRGWNRFRIQVPPGIIMVVGIGILATVSSGPLAQMWPTFVVAMIRFASVNSPTGVVRALLMDTVPKAQRGRWNALESLMSATWTASAVVGGYVADATSYRQAFMITFAFHSAGFCVLMLMFRNRDPREWLRPKTSVDKHDDDLGVE